MLRDGPYTQHIDACFQDSIGDRGLSTAETAALLARANDALTWLKEVKAAKSMPLLELAGRSDDLAELRPVAERFRKSFKHVVVLGIGGSSLGAATLYRLTEREFGGNAPQMHFFDNVDPQRYEAFFDAVDLSTVGILAVSKSGGTAETLVQILLFADALRKAGIDDLADRTVAISEKSDSPLRRFAEANNIPVFEHDPNIDGRYSVLSLVGMLPAMIAGVDVNAVRSGAAEVLNATVSADQAEQSPVAMGALINVGLSDHHGVSQTVLMPYLDRLDRLGLWYRQIWAESLGKNGKGSTPVVGVGAIDQHSQVQIYIDGPKDKLFTIVYGPHVGTGPKIQKDLIAKMDDGVDYLEGRTLGDLIDAEQRATADTLIANKLPTRIIRLASLDERALGALFMHFILETIIAARLWQVDPFGQPAVEQGKVLARQYLREMKT